jgi:hypothetical protein
MPSRAEFKERDTLTQVRQVAAELILFLPHAVNQMNSPERIIYRGNPGRCLSWVVVEDYPEDVRGHSCLMQGWGQGDRPVHVVCAPKADYLAIITTYLPSSTQWEPDWQTRRIR